MKRSILFIFTTLLLVGCNTDNLDFTFSPTEPHAGESVKITNLCDGDEWQWTYSDGTTSTSKNPTKIFKDPGDYTITLQVDGKKWKTISKSLTVLDTVPTIIADIDSLYKYQTITFSVDFYNPYSETVTYNWSYPETATLVSENLTSANLALYFTHASAQQTVNLTLTIGDVTHNLTYSFAVYDIEMPSILLADTKNLYRLPFYDTYFEKPTPLTETQFETITTILCGNNNLYVFDAQKAIYNIHLNTLKQEPVISLNGTDKGFYHGALVENALYWTDQYTTLYRMPAQLTNIETDGTKYIFANANDFSNLTVTHNGGIATYINSYFWAIGTGITIFQTPNGILQFQQTILNDYNVTNLQIDQIARKIYFLTTDNQFIITNIDGSNPRLLANNISCFTLDIDNNRLYFVSGTTLYQTPLIQSPNNQSAFTLTTIAENLPDIKSIILDPTKR